MKFRFHLGCVWLSLLLGCVAEAEIDRGSSPARTAASSQTSTSPFLVPEAELAAAVEQPEAALIAGSARPVAPNPPAQFKHPVVESGQTRVRVLMYHSIGWHPPRPGVSPRKLRDQLDWMSEHGVEIVRLSQLLAFFEGKLELPRKVAVITIDDGELNGYSVAFPIFRERRIPFTLGIATEAIQLWRSRGTMQWPQLRELVDSGLCEIASHSVSHRMMAHLSDRQVLRELEESRRLIEQETGFRPQAFFYPMGSQNTRVQRLTEGVGYRAAFVAWGAPVKRDSRRYALPRYAVEKGTGLYTFARFFSHGGE